EVPAHWTLFVGLDGWFRPLALVPLWVMRCPYCEDDSTHVLETREADGALRRRRACRACQRRFTTYERVEALPLSVRKRDGSSQPFDRDKLLRGLVRAAVKRPITVEQLEGIVD